MGVDLTVYSLVGLKVRPEELDYAVDRHEELYENDDIKIDFIFDGMCGDYAYVGLVLAGIGQYDYDGVGTVVPLFDKTFSAEHVASLIRLYFPDLTFEATDIAFHSFPHFH